MSYEKSKWTNGFASIGWLNDDEVIITSPYGGTCKIDGGDFESILTALCASKKLTNDDAESIGPNPSKAYTHTDATNAELADIDKGEGV